MNKNITQTDRVELTKIIEQHQLWLESKEKEGRQIDIKLFYELIGKHLVA